MSFEDINIILLKRRRKRIYEKDRIRMIAAASQPTHPCLSLRAITVRRCNDLAVAGWAAVADALECVTSVTSLNGCGQYAAIRAGCLTELKLDKEWELVVWAARYLPRSADTLTALDIRCV